MSNTRPEIITQGAALNMYNKNPTTRADPVTPGFDFKKYIYPSIIVSTSIIVVLLIFVSKISIGIKILSILLILIALVAYYLQTTGYDLSTWFPAPPVVP